MPMLKYEIINSPSRGTLAILRRKAQDADIREALQSRVEAVGLVQGPLAAIISAADIAEKAADVRVSEISGSCPQHITLLALFGSTSAVKTALQAVAARLG